jgi:hypothetical protein
VCKLKNGKAAGLDQILGRLIKEGRKELKKVIYELIKIKRKSSYHMIGNVACPVCKKGDVLYDNYRVPRRLLKGRIQLLIEFLL